MKWPSHQEYQEAFQWPEHSFSDPDLRYGSPLLDTLGLPKADSGNFATVYKMNCTSGTFAVKCFSTNRPDQEARYAKIAYHLKRWKLPCMVSFTFLPNGIKIGSQWYPILKMEWVEGDPLVAFLEKHIRSPRTIAEISKQFCSVMLQLQRASIAHGDLQHGNILVQANTIRLIDYDGMYVPGLQGAKSPELGHSNYQHPKRSAADFGSFLDNFSAWSIYISLQILCEDSSILKTVNRLNDWILLRKDDFLNPQTSKTLNRIRISSNLSIRESADFLDKLLQQNSLTNIPFFDPTLLSKKTVPVGTPQAVSPAPVPTSGQVNHVDASWVWDHMPSPEPALLWESVRIERLSLVVLSLFSVGLCISGLFAYSPIMAITGSGLFMITASSIFLGFRFRRLPLYIGKSSMKKDISKLETQSAVIKKSISELTQLKSKIPAELAKIKTDYDIKCAGIRKKDTNYIAAAEAQLAKTSQNIQKARYLLIKQESDEIASAFKDYTQRIVQTKLQTSALLPGTVSGIGERFTATLKYYGISSAADILEVSSDSIKRAKGDWLKIDGIGPVKAAALMDWRKSLERRFAPTSLPPNELDPIKKKFLATLQDFARQDREATTREQDEKAKIKAQSEKEFKLLELDVAKHSQQLKDKQNLLIDQVSLAEQKLAKMEWEISCKNTELARFRQVTFGDYLKRILWPKETEDRLNLATASAGNIALAKTVPMIKRETVGLVKRYALVALIFLAVAIIGYKRSEIYESVDTTVTHSLAEPADVSAQEQLVPMYYEGNGVPKSREEALKWLKLTLERGGDFSRALLLAADMGDLEVLNFVVDKGADLHTTDEHGNTALILAAGKGQLDMVKFLLEKGADVNAKNKINRTAMKLALMEGQLDVVKFLVDIGADVNTRDEDGNTALIKAAAQGQLDVVKFLIEKGADVNANNKTNDTAMKAALTADHLEVAKFLVDKGADVNTKGRGAETALMKASATGRLNLVQILIDRKADLNARDEQGNTALMKACEKGLPEVAQYLISNGAEVNAKDDLGRTALMKASASGILRAVKTLIDKTKDVNAKDNQGNTALTRASETGQLEATRFLIERGAHLNSKDDAGNSALMKASGNGHLDVIKVLVDKRADLKTMDNDGNNALMRASATGHLDVVNFLLGKGLDVNASDRNGETALMKASKIGATEIVKTLIHKGALVSTKDKDGHTAIRFAANKGFFSIVGLLEDYGGEE